VLKRSNGLHILLLPNPWPLTSNQRLKCVFSEAGLHWHLGWGRSVYLKRVGGGSALVALKGGRPILLFLLSPASEKRGIRYRWHPCTFSMIRVEDSGSSFMLYLGPGPPSLLCMTRANEKSPYAGGTMPSINVKFLNYHLMSLNAKKTLNIFFENFICEKYLF
jgi:hypothetical protein